VHAPQRDVTKASHYPLGEKAHRRVILECVVDVGKVKRIDAADHPLQKTWLLFGYDVAWVPPHCGMVPSGLEEDCVADPRRSVPPHHERTHARTHARTSALAREGLRRRMLIFYGSPTGLVCAFGWRANGGAVTVVRRVRVDEAAIDAAAKHAVATQAALAVHTSQTSSTASSGGACKGATCRSGAGTLPSAAARARVDVGDGDESEGSEMDGMDEGWLAKQRRILVMEDEERRQSSRAGESETHGQHTAAAPPKKGRDATNGHTPPRSQRAASSSTCLLPEKAAEPAPLTSSGSLGRGHAAWPTRADEEDGEELDEGWLAAQLATLDSEEEERERMRQRGGGEEEHAALPALPPTASLTSHALEAALAAGAAQLQHERDESLLSA
jgi:hypothetical protein